ncbi:transcription repressor OFP17 [Cornus florida]|uniref:transcription repressor OFP17 n=1 Tax=Cornus florida TaxID=4283 RepID=UPI0028A0C37B|nr:transcription repressor OFP17 [Cornus florida]
MKVKAPVSFKCKKLLNPCRKILQIFKFRFKKPLFIKSLQFRRSQTEVRKRPKRNRVLALLSVLRSRKESRKMDRAMELKSFSDAGHQKAPFPSPLTPAYVRMSVAAKKEVSGQDDVEDACRSFENYLAEMIVEEGKVKDLIDVEELLYCWKNLKCPVFIDLVCRFYGELCKDLFSSNEHCIESP